MTNLIPKEERPEDVLPKYLTKPGANTSFYREQAIEQWKALVKERDEARERPTFQQLRNAEDVRERVIADREAKLSEAQATITELRRQLADAAKCPTCGSNDVALCIRGGGGFHYGRHIPNPHPEANCLPCQNPFHAAPSPDTGGEET